MSRKDDPVSSILQEIIELDCPSSESWEDVKKRLQHAQSLLVQEKQDAQNAADSRRWHQERIEQENHKRDLEEWHRNQDEANRAAEQMVSQAVRSGLKSRGW